MKRRVFFYSPNRGANLPLVWGCLRAHAETNPEIVAAYSFEAPFYRLEHVQTAAEQIQDPHILLLSCYIWNLNKNLNLARQVKTRFPNALVVVGGPHVPDVADSFMRQNCFVDIAIHGEGEIPFTMLLLELLRDAPDLSRVPSLTYRRVDGEPVSTLRSSLTAKQIDVPSPYLLGYFDECISESRDAGYLPVALWETNRGCPYSCSFCDWGSATMSKIRKFSDERLHREIEFFAANQISMILCCDANFGILPRDVELTRRIVEAKTNCGYPRRFVTNYAKNASSGVLEISKLFVSSEMADGIILAMQSANDDVLEAINRSNIPVENYRKFNREFRKAGIQRWTEIILGLPRETRDSFVGGMCDILDCGIHDDVMVYECVILPNSEFGREEYRHKYNLQTITRPYLLNDVEEVEVIVATNTLSKEDWVYCYLFGCVIQSLHNRAISRYLAIYLHEENLLTYAQFYRPFLDHALRTPDLVFGKAISRLEQLLWDYLNCSEIPNEGKVHSQMDMLQALNSVAPSKHDWLPYEWCWAQVQKEIDTFYLELTDFLMTQGLVLDSKLRSLLRFQRDNVVVIGEERAHVAIYEYDWSKYFSDDTFDLQERLTIKSYQIPADLLR